MDSSLLYFFVRDAVRQYSEDFRIIDRNNPVTFLLNGQKYSTHVSYVHDSGNARDNEDERRIQISRGLIEMQRARLNEKNRVAFIGFFEGGKVFVAWDPRHVFSLEAKTIVSVYARQSQLAGVEENQAAVHSFTARLLGETSLAIALPAKALGLYLENTEHFHRLPSEATVQDLLRTHTTTLSEAGLGAGGDFDFKVGSKREKFTFTRTAYPRDPKFQKNVLNAYGQACCICNRQLGLVQAAHIIPHSEPNCPNSVQNGLAMCIEHHRLYDDALVLPGPGQKLIFNQERATYLIGIGLGRGLDQVEELSKNKYKIPGAVDSQPLDSYLKKGLKIRLGS